jgi:hypothetical protein
VIRQENPVRAIGQQLLGDPFDSVPEKEGHDFGASPLQGKLLRRGQKLKGDLGHTAFFLLNENPNSLPILQIFPIHHHRLISIKIRNPKHEFRNKLKCPKFKFSKSCFGSFEFRVCFDFILNFGPLSQCLPDLPDDFRYHLRSLSITAFRFISGRKTSPVWVGIR